MPGCVGGRLVSCIRSAGEERCSAILTAHRAAIAAGQSQSVPSRTNCPVPVTAVGQFLQLQPSDEEALHVEGANSAPK
jgi:hypothetical protein